LCKIRIPFGKTISLIIFIVLGFSLSLMGAQLVANFGAPQLVKASTDDKESDLTEEEKEEKKQDPRGTCYGTGYNHGQDGQFNTAVYNDNCYGEYYEGFIDGCTDLGNTRDVCESATDS
jgi:hypothetical protein